jgi:hypothetical protein
MAAKKGADPVFSFDQTSVASERNYMYCPVYQTAAARLRVAVEPRKSPGSKGGERQRKRELSELAASPTGRPTVLCINDIPQASELRKTTLGSHGYCVKIASSGHTARGSTGVQTGHGCGIPSLPYRATGRATRPHRFAPDEKRTAETAGGDHLWRYAESRMIGGLGNPCIHPLATGFALASIPRFWGGFYA